MPMDAEALDAIVERAYEEAPEGAAVHLTLHLCTALPTHSRVALTGVASLPVTDDHGTVRLRGLGGGWVCVYACDVDYVSYSVVL